MTLAPDTTLADRYVLEGRLAVGGMGEVWTARDTVLDRKVAVKVLKTEYAADPAFLDRFRREARHTASLSHPGIANVFDYGEIGDVAYLVMELVTGEPLSAVLARDGHLPAERALDIVGQAALALQAAHDAGVVHRDVKPGNLLIRPDGVVKVTDFGIARAIDAAPVTQTGLVVGTAAYLSPEQAGGKPITPASDVYSLGVVTYECLTGARPFDGDSAVGVAMAHLTHDPPPLRDVPPVVADFVLRSLQKDPARRQPSAGDFGRTALALAASLHDAEKEAATPAAASGDGGTRILPMPAPVVASTPADVPDGDRDRRRIRNAFVAIGAFVVVLGFVVLRSCGGATYASVPRVVGDSYASAASTLAKVDLHAHERVVHDPAHTAGTVLAQDAKPGARLTTGTTVTLTVASGPQLVQVSPADYIGKPVAQVERALRARHLLVTVVPEPSKQPAGSVTAVHPSGSVREGSTVTVTVAVAPAPPPRQPGKHKDHHGD